MDRQKRRQIHTMENEMRKREEEEKSIFCNGEIGEAKGRELLRET